MHRHDPSTDAWLLPSVARSISLIARSRPHCLGLPGTWSHSPAGSPQVPTSGPLAPRMLQSQADRMAMLSITAHVGPNHRTCYNRVSGQRRTTTVHRDNMRTRHPCESAHSDSANPRKPGAARIPSTMHHSSPRQLCDRCNLIHTLPACQVNTHFRQHSPWQGQPSVGPHSPSQRPHLHWCTTAPQYHRSRARRPVSPPVPPPRCCVPWKAARPSRLRRMRPLDRSTARPGGKGRSATRLYHHSLLVLRCSTWPGVRVNVRQHTRNV